MSIFSRISDILNSELNALLDKVEDPEATINLIVREMEDTLVDVKSSAAKIIAEKKMLEKKIVQSKQIQANWNGKAALAVKKERNDLAKKALLEKHKFIEDEGLMLFSLVEIDKNLDSFRLDICKLENKLKDAKVRRKGIILKNAIFDSHKSINKIEPKSAFNKFEHLEKDIERLEANTELVISDTTLEDEFKKLQYEDKIEKELEEIKKKNNI